MEELIDKILLAYRMLSEKQVKYNKELDRERREAGLPYLWEEDKNAPIRRERRFIKENGFYTYDDHLYMHTTKTYQSYREKDLAQIVSQFLKRTKLKKELREFANDYGGMTYLSRIALTFLPDIREEQNNFFYIKRINDHPVVEKTSKEHFEDIFIALTQIKTMFKK